MDKFVKALLIAYEIAAEDRLKFATRVNAI